LEYTPFGGLEAVCPRKSICSGNENMNGSTFSHEGLDHFSVVITTFGQRFIEGVEASNNNYQTIILGSWFKIPVVYEYDFSA
jgi:hypothetical protein